MATSAGTSLQEYLDTSYCPDVEFLEGELKQKQMGKIPHGRVQGLLVVWFWLHGEQWQVFAASEVRTQVSSDNVRLPDVVVLPASTKERGALTHPPLVAIEIVSPTDSHAELERRASDLARMGVENIWLLDEVGRTLGVWQGGAWVLEEGTRVEARNSPIYLDLAWLWQQLDSGR